jgi:hypothetical protein
MVIIAAAQYCELRSRTANLLRSFKLLPYNKLIIRCARLIEAASCSTKYCEVICSGGRRWKSVKNKIGDVATLKLHVWWQSRAAIPIKDNIKDSPSPTKLVVP